MAGGRLESLWAGDFGDAYVDRNSDAARGRRDFWAGLVDELGFASALEVGCNVGANLRWLAELLGTEHCAGVDVNAKALERLSAELPGVDTRLAPGRELPFADESFELAFTMGVLIHVPPEDLHAVMREVVRASARWVLCGEYFAESETEVPYRGQEGALFKRPYGDEYLRACPELELVSEGFLARGEGSWDDVTYWVFRKPRRA
jgi:spore coat polysaccharide biosynthesis protein SpsF